MTMRTNIEADFARALIETNQKLDRICDMFGIVVPGREYIATSKRQNHEQIAAVEPRHEPTVMTERQGDKQKAADEPKSEPTASSEQQTRQTPRIKQETQPTTTYCQQTGEQSGLPSRRSSNLLPRKKTEDDRKIHHQAVASYRGPLQLSDDLISRRLAEMQRQREALLRQREVLLRQREVLLRQQAEAKQRTAPQTQLPMPSVHLPLIPKETPSSDFYETFQRQQHERIERQWAQQMQQLDNIQRQRAIQNAQLENMRRQRAESMKRTGLQTHPLMPSMHFPPTPMEIPEQLRDRAAAAEGRFGPSFGVVKDAYWDQLRPYRALLGRTNPPPKPVETSEQIRDRQQSQLQSNLSELSEALEDLVQRLPLPKQEIEEFLVRIRKTKSEYDDRQRTIDDRQTTPLPSTPQPPSKEKGAEGVPTFQEIEELLKTKNVGFLSP